jgi:hypothetical protein
MTGVSQVQDSYLRMLNMIQLMPDGGQKEKMLEITDFLMGKARESELRQELEQGVL